MTPPVHASSLSPMTIPADPPIRRVVLLGFMAAGKTSVGVALAARLGWTAVDLDREIERRQGRRVAEIFAAEGEARFREMEAAETRTLARRDDVVLSPGGGWMLDPTNLEALGSGTLSVWLQVSPEEAVARAAAAPGERPLLAGPDPLAAARALLEARAPLYARAALHLRTDGRTANDLAAEIEAVVRARRPGPTHKLPP